MKIAVQLAPFFTLVLLAYGLTFYRLNKKFKAETRKGMWEWMERNPVEVGYLLGMVTCSTLLWPGLGNWLAKLL